MKIQSLCLFVSSTTVLCLYIFAFTWINIMSIMKSYHCHLWKALVKSPVSGILILYTFAATWFLGDLTAFHLYLFAPTRYRYINTTNTYNRGLARNMWETFCSEVPESKNNFRAKVKEDSLSIFNASLSMGRGIIESRNGQEKL
ncbi:hypothetical protein GIB67_035080 [Kingdonia uniflora]|uniref:Palmitoyltransferase n=1 Tax=Kingdonia uniflora TaxID=39325 RepID=A0A7J7L1M2_9MAGN|nr:hypothetical protein GIB67_035080 [Kingdonia uniflora]